MSRPHEGVPLCGEKSSCISAIYSHLPRQTSSPLESYGAVGSRKRKRAAIVGRPGTNRGRQRALVIDVRGLASSFLQPLSSLSSVIIVTLDSPRKRRPGAREIHTPIPAPFLPQLCFIKTLIRYFEHRNATTRDGRNCSPSICNSKGAAGKLNIARSLASRRYALREHSHIL